MSNIRTIAVAVTTTGTAGSATGSTTTESLFGELIDVYLDFHASTPATTDTTIAYATRGGNILVVTSSATDVLLAPRQGLVTSGNVAITDGSERFFLNGPLTISLAQADALTDAVVVYLRVLAP